MNRERNTDGGENDDELINKCYHPRCTRGKHAPDEPHSFEMDVDGRKRATRGTPNYVNRIILDDVIDQAMEISTDMELSDIKRSRFRKHLKRQIRQFINNIGEVTFTRKFSPSLLTPIVTNAQTGSTCSGSRLGPRSLACHPQSVVPVERH